MNLFHPWETHTSMFVLFLLPSSMEGCLNLPSMHLEYKRLPVYDLQSPREENEGQLVSVCHAWDQYAKDCGLPLLIQVCYLFECINLCALVCDFPVPAHDFGRPLTLTVASSLSLHSPPLCCQKRCYREFFNQPQYAQWMHLLLSLVFNLLVRRHSCNKGACLMLPPPLFLNNISPSTNMDSILLFKDIIYVASIFPSSSMI